jgi:hypothetical protein
VRLSTGVGVVGVEESDSAVDGVVLLAGDVISFPFFLVMIVSMPDECLTSVLSLLVS